MGQVAIKDWASAQMMMQSGTGIPQIPAAPSGMSSKCTGSEACSPSISMPFFVSTKEADHFLDDADEVIGVVYKGEAKAYPLKILNWHKVVNDNIRQLPIAVTYDPFCGTAIAYERMLNNRPILLGAIPSTNNSCIMLYDNITGTTWDQVTGAGRGDEHAEVQLKPIPSSVTTWKAWKTAYSRSTVLSTRTGYAINYNIGRYDNARARDDTLLPSDNGSSRLHPKDIVYGIVIDGIPKAYPEAVLETRGLLEDGLAGRTALLTKDAAGIVRMFNTTVNGQALHFVSKAGKIYENATNSEFTADGRGITRVYQDTQLQELTLTRAYWFAWYQFYPMTTIVS